MTIRAKIVTNNNAVKLSSLEPFQLFKRVYDEDDEPAEKNKYLLLPGYNEISGGRNCVNINKPERGIQWIYPWREVEILGTLSFEDC